jgi:hypothetical protein
MGRGGTRPDHHFYFMPYDPAFPATSVPLVSAEFRSQFNALKALIDAQAAQIATLNTQMSQRITTADALAVFASNISGTAGDATAFDDPPTQAQIEALRDNLNALIVGLQA